MRTMLADAPLFYHIDLVALGDGLQAMGNHDQSHTHAIEVFHHLGFCLRIECRGALVHQQDGGLLGQSRSYLDALALAATEVLAALQDGTLIGARALHDFMMYLSIVASQHHGEIFNRLIPHLDIVCNGALEERHILINY